MQASKSFSELRWWAVEDRILIPEESKGAVLVPGEHLSGREKDGRSHNPQTWATKVVDVVDKKRLFSALRRWSY